MVLATGKPKEVKPIIDFFGDRGIDLNKCLSVLARCKYQDVIDFVDFFETNNMDIQTFLNTIAYSDIDEAKKLAEYLLKKKVDLNSCVTLLAKGKLDRVRKLWPKLKKLGIDIETSTSILLREDVDEVIDIINYLDSEKLDVRKCPVVLVKGKLSEIKKIVVLLKEEMLDLDKCLTVLAYGKYDEIVKLIPLLSSRINLNDCLSVLAYGNYEDVKAIVKLFDDNSIDISKNTSCVFRCKPKEVEDILCLLKNHGVDVSKLPERGVISKIFRTYKFKGLKTLFKKEEEGNLSREEIKFLFLIEGGWGKYYDQKDIKQMCNRYSISQEQFIDIFGRVSSHNTTALQERLTQDKDIWIGDTYPLLKDDLSEYQQLIMKIVKYSVRKFVYLTDLYHIKKDLEGVCLDIVIERCGGLFYNYKDNLNVLVSVLITYCSKRLYSILNEVTTYEYRDDKAKKSMYEELDYEDGKVIFNNIKFSHEEKVFLHHMSELVTKGIVNFEEIMLERLNMDIDSYNMVLSQIQTKIIQGSDPKVLSKKLAI